MASTLILGPVLAQVGLTLAVFVLLLLRKSVAVKSGQVDRQKVALDNKSWPDQVVQASNNIANQFETPILFYVLCLSALALNAVSGWLIVLAWGYVLSRCVHCYIHVSSNYVPLRMKVFAVGVLILFFMVAYLAWYLTFQS